MDDIEEREKYIGQEFIGFKWERKLSMNGLGTGIDFNAAGMSKFIGTTLKILDYSKDFNAYYVGLGYWYPADGVLENLIIKKTVPDLFKEIIELTKTK